jgi:hypothetical protein
MQMYPSDHYFDTSLIPLSLLKGGYNNAEMELIEQCRNGKKWIVSQNLKN